MTRCIFHINHTVAPLLTHSLMGSMSVLFLSVRPYKWNHTLCSLWTLLCFTQYNALVVIQVICGNSLFFLQLSSITVYGGITFLFIHLAIKRYLLCLWLMVISTKFLQIMYVGFCVYIYQGQVLRNYILQAKPSPLSVYIIKSSCNTTTPFNCYLWLLLHYKSRGE